MPGQARPGIPGLLQTALAIDPDNAETHINISHYYCAEKNGKLVSEHLEQAERPDIQVEPQFVEEIKMNCP